MLLGIDVGGTFTDAVIIDCEKIIAKAKKHTTNPNIESGILQALDDVMQYCPDKAKIKRVTISTTIVTNAVTTAKLPEVEVYVIPGPGLNCENAFPVKPIILQGYTDHRGKVTAPADYKKQTEHDVPAAISAKFATRNAQSELALKNELTQKGKQNIIMGHNMSGQLGFIRRTNSSYYTAATSKLFYDFILTVKNGLHSHNISAPLYVLKADGGTMPAQWLEQHTVESYFTGPAASVMGIKALLDPAKNCISLDIGGTTTDIAFWENSLPLYSKRGAKIKNYPTSVRSLHLRSIGIGGDSLVQRRNKQIQVGPDRLGPAMALGGSYPTLTDAFLLLGYDTFGDKNKAEQAMQMIALACETPEQTAQKVLDVASASIIRTIKEMVEEYDLEPVYKVEDVVKAKSFMPELIVGVGGAAPGIVPQVAKLLGLKHEIPQNAFIANAVGAAVAQATLTADLRADTALGEGVLAQANKKIKIDKSFSAKDARNILHEWLEAKAKELGLDYTGTEVVWQEEFPVIRDSWRSGSIINLSMQLKPGVLFPVKGDDV